MRARWTWWTLILAAPVGAAEPERSAVVAVGQCSVAGSAISARTFRAALTQRLGPSVQTEMETAAPFGGLAQKTLPELNVALSSARSDFYADKSESALATVKQALEDVVRLAPSETRWVAERDMLTFKSQVELRTDHAAAQVTLSRVFRVDPAYKPDTSIYPPSYQRFAEDVRKAMKKLGSNRLDISVSPPGKAVFVGGKPAGAAPLTLHLPPGEYRVEVDWGYRGLVPVVTVPPAPVLPKPVELAASVEGALAPDGGPCVQPREDAATALARLLPTLGVGKIYGVRTGTSGADTYAVVTEVGGLGSEQRTVRVKLPPGAPEGEALGMIAGFFHTGRSTPLVETVPKGAPDVPPVLVAAPPPPAGTTAPVASVTKATSSGSGLRTAGWVLGGIGVAGVAVGVIEFLSANSQKNDLTSQQTNGAFPAGYQSTFQSTNDSIKSKQTIAVIAGGVGAAALVTGVILIIVGGNQSSSSVSVSPSVIPGGGGALVAGSF
jgi:PEGA domain